MSSVILEIIFERITYRYLKRLIDKFVFRTVHTTGFNFRPDFFSSLTALVVLTASSHSRRSPCPRCRSQGPVRRRGSRRRTGPGSAARERRTEHQPPERPERQPGRQRQRQPERSASAVRSP
jgi:hypothetical protein